MAGEKIYSRTFPHDERAPRPQCLSPPTDSRLRPVGGGLAPWPAPAAVGGSGAAGAGTAGGTGGWDRGRVVVLRRRSKRCEVRRGAHKEGCWVWQKYYMMCLQLLEAFVDVLSLCLYITCFVVLVGSASSAYFWRSRTDYVVANRLAFGFRDLLEACRSKASVTEAPLQRRARPRHVGRRYMCLESQSWWLRYCRWRWGGTRTQAEAEVGDTANTQTPRATKRVTCLPRHLEWLEGAEKKGEEEPQSRPSPLRNPFVAW